MTLREILLEQAQCPWLTINKISFACLHGDMVMLLTNTFILVLSGCAWMIDNRNKRGDTKVDLAILGKVIFGV